MTKFRVPSNALIEGYDSTHRIHFNFLFEMIQNRTWTNQANRNLILGHMKVVLGFVCKAQETIHSTEYQIPPEFLFFQGVLRELGVTIEPDNPVPTQRLITRYLIKLQVLYRCVNTGSPLALTEAELDELMKFLETAYLYSRDIHLYILSFNQLVD